MHKFLHVLCKRHGKLIQKSFDASKEHATRSKGTENKPDDKYHPDQNKLPSLPGELTSGLLHCLSTLPDPWPLAKITINLESASKWALKILCLFYADQAVRQSPPQGGRAKSLPVEAALSVAPSLLQQLELRIFELLAEWMVALPMPAKHLLELGAEHLTFMLSKDCWFKEFYLGLTVAASFRREESFEKAIEGQIRCISSPHDTAKGNIAWNVSYINVFIPAWSVPPIYHSLRREHLRCLHSKLELGVTRFRPSWFEDETVARDIVSQSVPDFVPMHGLRLSIQEMVAPMRERP